MAFIKHTKGSLSYYTDELIDSLGGLDYIFTTRLGGVSSGDLASLNLGTGRDDKRENILENYKRACAAVNLDYTKCVLAKQTHTTNIRIVVKNDCGKGLTAESDIRDTDGLITAEPRSDTSVRPEKESLGLPARRLERNCERHCRKGRKYYERYVRLRRYLCRNRSVDRFVLL